MAPMQNTELTAPAPQELKHEAYMPILIGLALLLLR